ncbi:MAG TPA: hypothetical protein VGK73_28880 [Polyangiaceae bacterium]
MDRRLGGRGGDSGEGGEEGIDQPGVSGRATGAGGTATGGAGTVGAGTGGAGTGGVTSGGAGSGGTVSVIPGVTCDWPTALQKNCAISSCHGKLFQYGDLLWTPTTLDSMGRDLIARLKDVPPSLADVDCDPGLEYVECTSPPPECQPYVGAKLIDSANPDASFILAKLAGAGCGNQMPLDPGSSPNNGWGPERLACIEELVRGIAALP